jgi:hypothetical protein
MTRYLYGFLTFLIASPAFAQAQAEPPTEKASMLTVAIFLLLFVGGCLGYFVYLWWTHKHSGADTEEPQKP